MTAKTECSKCGGAIHRGFIYDRGDYEVKTQQVWVEGEPEQSFWSGIKTSGRDAYKVEAYCCDGCDHLEFYTTELVDL